MEELANIFTSIGRLLAIVGGGLSAICVCYAGILWMTASGDPGKMGQARTALIGAIGGLVVVGIAFIVPRVISQAVIEPVGGVSLQSDTGFDCDQTLRQQLVFQRGASTSSNINEIIAQIQATRSECPTDVWNPQAADGAGDTVAGVTTQVWANDATATGISRCFGATQPADAAARAAMAVGSQKVPRGLRDQNADDQLVRSSSGRNSDNDIIVYWSNTDALRPSDGAKCWLYVSRLRTWSENY